MSETKDYSSHVAAAAVFMVGTRVTLDPSEVYDLADALVEMHADLIAWKARAEAAEKELAATREAVEERCEANVELRERADAAEAKLDHVNEAGVEALRAMRERAEQAERERDALRAKVAAWRPVVEASVELEAAEGDELAPCDPCADTPRNRRVRKAEQAWRVAVRALPEEARP